MSPVQFGCTGLKNSLPANVTYRLKHALSFVVIFFSPLAQTGVFLKIASVRSWITCPEALDTSPLSDALASFSLKSQQM